MSKEIPIGVALIICDRVITDAMTHEKTLVGTFHQLTSFVFPCILPRLTVFVGVSNGRGYINTEVRCINETEQNTTVFAMKGVIPFNNPNDTIEMGFQFHNTQFQKPGVHAIHLLCEGNLILQRRFTLIKANPPMPPFQPTSAPS